MDAIELARLVKRCRDAQRQFFRGNRTSEVLAECKQLEAAVDRACADILSGQQGLYPREERRG